MDWGWIVLALSGYVLALVGFGLAAWNAAQARSYQHESWAYKHERDDAQAQLENIDSDARKRLEASGRRIWELETQVNTAQEHILALELQLAEEKSKQTGRSERDTVELPEQEYEVLPQSEKPKRASRAKRTGQEQA